MKREIKFYQGFDCIKFECMWGSKRCVPDGGGSHGRHGLDIGFFLHGAKGVVQFKLSTGWKIQATKKNNIGYREIFASDNKLAHLYPMPTDIGYHSYKPMYEGQEAIQQKCELLGGKPCYYDGSSLNASNVFYTLLNGGTEELWKYLEGYYNATFNNGEYPEVFEYPKPRRVK